MRFKILLQLFLFFMYMHLHAQPITASIPDSYGSIGSTVIIPINVENFSTIAAITIKIKYPKSVVSFLSVSNWASPISGANFYNDTANGILGLAWESTTSSISITTGKLVDLSFNYAGGSGMVEFLGTQCEIADTAGEIISSVFYQGSISQFLMASPALQLPANGSAGQSLTTFTWASVTQAQKYHLQVATSLDFTQTVISDSNILVLTRTMFGLQYNTKYYWRVRGKGANGWGSWSNPWVFTTRQGINLILKAYLQGLYNPEIDKMSTGDTIKVALYSTSAPFTQIDFTLSYIDTGGNAIAPLGIANSGSYYIVLRHRNSIETWSSFPEALTKGSAINYNFSIDASQAYGFNLVQKGEKFCIYSGDVNQDGFVDFSDLVTIDNDAYNFSSGYVVTDLNGDAFIDFTDLVICDNNAYNFIGVMRPN